MRTEVTIIDHIFYTNELGLSDLSPNPLLTVHIGDTRNVTLLSSVFTPDVVGMVHLASISCMVQCAENPRDCTDVDECGTRLICDSLEQLNSQDQGKQWFILASSVEVYSETTAAITLHEDARTKPSSVYGNRSLRLRELLRHDHLAIFLLFPFVYRTCTEARTITTIAPFHPLLLNHYGTK